MIIDKQVDEKLVAFLVDENVLDQFLVNKNNESRSTGIIAYVSQAFIWDDSPEGYTFWADLGAKFRGV